MNKLAQSIIFFAIGFCWVAILWGVSGNASAGEYTVYGSGTKSCGEYIANSDKYPDRYIYASWALGALSYAGYVELLVNGNLDDTDSATVYLYLSNYCSANPLMDFNDAVYALIEELAESGVAQ